MDVRGKKSDLEKMSTTSYGGDPCLLEVSIGTGTVSQQYRFTGRLQGQLKGFTPRKHYIQPSQSMERYMCCCGRKRIAPGIKHVHTVSPCMARFVNDVRRSG